jgi:hypothetical protein
MSYTHTIVGHFPSHSEAERVVLELQKKASICKSSRYGGEVRLGGDQLNGHRS